MKRPPISLHVLAGLFILVGLLAVARTIADCCSRPPVRADLQGDVVCLLIGLGLIRRRQVWRIVGLVWLWIIVLALGVYLAWVAFGALPPYFPRHVPGWYVNPDLAVGVTIAAFEALCLWGIGVLNKPHVKACFLTSAPANHGAVVQSATGMSGTHRDVSTGPPSET